MDRRHLSGRCSSPSTCSPWPWASGRRSLPSFALPVAFALRSWPARSSPPTPAAARCGGPSLVLAAGPARRRSCVGWGLVALFPGTLPNGQRAGLGREPRLRRPLHRRRLLRRPPAPPPVLPGSASSAPSPCSSPPPPLPLPAGRRPARRRGAPDPRTPRRVRPGRLARLLRHPARQRGHLPPSGRAAVTYRVVGGVCLASGDPIGDRAAWARAIAAWLEEAREYAWTPAVMGASEAGATAYARAGLGRWSSATRRSCTRRLRPRRPGHARHPAGGAPGRARRRHRPHPPAPHTHRRGDGPDRRAGRPLAGHRDRTRLLDGPGPARRPGRRRLPPGRGPGRRRPDAALLSLPRGAATASRST